METVICSVPSQTDLPMGHHSNRLTLRITQICRIAHSFPQKAMKPSKNRCQMWRNGDVYRGAISYHFCSWTCKYLFFVPKIKCWSATEFSDLLTVGKVAVFSVKYRHIQFFWVILCIWFSNNCKLNSPKLDILNSFHSRNCKLSNNAQSP